MQRESARRSTEALRVCRGGRRERKSSLPKSKEERRGDIAKGLKVYHCLRRKFGAATVWTIGARRSGPLQVGKGRLRGAHGCMYGMGCALMMLDDKCWMMMLDVIC